MSPEEDRIFHDVQGQPIPSATKNRIIAASIELFAAEGYSGASVRDITGKVGIKESSLYKHFKNKDEILETIFAHFRRETDNMLPPLQHLDAIARTMSVTELLERGIALFLEHMNDPINRQVWRILYNELFRHPIARQIYVQELMQRSVDCMAAVFEKMIEQGKMKPIPARTAALEYECASISLILEYNLLLAENKSTELLEGRIREHVRFFSSLISTES